MLASRRLLKATPEVGHTALRVSSVADDRVLRLNRRQFGLFIVRDQLTALEHDAGVSIGVNILRWRRNVVDVLNVGSFLLPQVFLRRVLDVVAVELLGWVFGFGESAPLVLRSNKLVLRVLLGQDTVRDAELLQALLLLLLVVIFGVLLRVER